MRGQQPFFSDQGVDQAGFACAEAPAKGDEGFVGQRGAGAELAQALQLGLQAQPGVGKAGRAVVACEGGQLLLDKVLQRA